MSQKINLSSCQETAFAQLKGKNNIFLTGAAGTGKSFLVEQYLKNLDPENFPILASTGTAALLVGGRTFHSFFGLGILEGGAQATFERALRNRRLVKRLKKISGFLVDEISMISGETLAVAERICRTVRANDEPWGALRVILVGDFAQLPPVSRFSNTKDWAFKSDVWLRSDFSTVKLKSQIRSQDSYFNQILNKIRLGQVDSDVIDFLRERSAPVAEDFTGTRIFPHRQTSENYNLKRLEEIDSELVEIPTDYIGEERIVESIKRSAPVPELLRLKSGALIMLRQNDLNGAWVNGSLGHISRIESKSITVKLIDGPEVEVKPTKFTSLDADGKEVGSAHNFPINLAYAATIHKTQGATLSRMCVNIKGAWEHGQAYVALSRVRRAEDLVIQDFSANSIWSDPEVSEFI